MNGVWSEEQCLADIERMGQNSFSDEASLFKRTITLSTFCTCEMQTIITHTHLHTLTRNVTKIPNNELQLIDTKIRAFDNQSNHLLLASQIRKHGALTAFFKH